MCTKIAIYKIKKKDKQEAKKNKNKLIYAILYLQAALSSLFEADSQNYHKRKLIMYNFTVYDSRKKGFCYYTSTCDETGGKKGSAEISSWLMK